MRTDDVICRWVAELPTTFLSNNIELIGFTRFPPVNDLRKATTDNYLMGMEDIGVMAASKPSALLGSHEEFRDLFTKAVQETEQGVSLELDMIVVVGRKPTSRISLRL